MARSAKEVEHKLTPKFINGTITEIFDVLDAIESERGRFMAKVKREREKIVAVYERAASNGVAQRVMKLQIEIEKLNRRILGKVADLETEHRKMLQQVVKLHGNKAQLALFSDLPKTTKPKKGKADNVVRLADAWDDEPKPVAAE